MSAFGRAVRMLGWVLLVVVGFTLVFPIAWSALAREPIPPPIALPRLALDSATVYVTDWAYHTSIAVPQPAGWALGPAGNEAAPWLEYSWGDRRFFRDGDHRPDHVFAALALPTATVMYLVGRAEPPSSRDGARAIYARRVDGATLGALLAELEGTIRRGGSGARVAPALPNGRDPGRFYDAYGSYLWTRDCNRWTVDRLAAVGLAGTGRGVVFSGQVAGRLRGFRTIFEVHDAR